MTNIAYTASGLADIADAFDLYASDQLAARRWQSTAKGKRECEIRADVWKDAAEILRATTITGAA